MKKLPILFFLAVVAASCISIGCSDDTTPEYWVDRMYERRFREDSIKKLNEKFSIAMEANQNNLASPAVKILADEIVPGLVQAFKDFDRDSINRAEIIKLLTRMKDPRGVEIFMQAIDMDAISDSNMFEVAAAALAAQGVENCVPRLLSAHQTIVDARSKRPGAPFTGSENEIEQAVIQTSSLIIANNPNSPHKGVVVKMLSDIAQTSDKYQDLRLNMKAIQGLGRIGDSSGIPTLIKGIAMRGERQQIGLGPIAFAALQQIHDRDAVVEAVLAFAKGTDASFNEYYKKELENDQLMKNPIWPRQEASTFLGMLNYPSPKVIEFFVSELNHTEPDELDSRTAEIKDLAQNYTAEGWAVFRRNWAAVALAQLSYKDELDVIENRVEFKGNVLQTTAEEAVGYIRSMGILLYPDKSCKLLRRVGEAANDDSMEDKVFYNASLMCGTDFIKPIEASIKKANCAGRFPNEDDEEEKRARSECETLVKRFESYIGRVKLGDECGNNIDCYAKVAQARGDDRAERAIYSMYIIARDDSSKQAAVIDIMANNLRTQSEDVMSGVVFAIDRLVQKADDKLLTKIQEVNSFYGAQTAYKERARTVESLLGRLKNKNR